MSEAEWQDVARKKGGAKGSSPMDQLLQKLTFMERLMGTGGAGGVPAHRVPAKRKPGLGAKPPSWTDGKAVAGKCGLCYLAYHNPKCIGHDCRDVKCAGMVLAVTNAKCPGKDKLHPSDKKAAAAAAARPPTAPHVRPPVKPAVAAGGEQGEQPPPVIDPPKDPMAMCKPRKVLLDSVAYMEALLQKSAADSVPTDAPWGEASDVTAQPDAPTQQECELMDALKQVHCMTKPSAAVIASMETELAALRKARLDSAEVVQPLTAAGLARLQSHIEDYAQIQSQKQAKDKAAMQAKYEALTKERLEMQATHEAAQRFQDRAAQLLERTRAKVPVVNEGITQQLDTPLTAPQMRQFLTQAKPVLAEELTKKVAPELLAQISPEALTQVTEIIMLRLLQEMDARQKGLQQQASAASGQAVDTAGATSSPAPNQPTKRAAEQDACAFKASMDELDAAFAATRTLAESIPAAETMEVDAADLL